MNIKLPGKIIKKICDNGSTMYLLDDGTLYNCGDNSNSRLGIDSAINPVTVPTKINIANVKDIAMCGNCTLFLLNIMSVLVKIQSWILLKNIFLCLNGEIGRHA